LQQHKKIYKHCKNNWIHKQVYTCFLCPAIWD